MHVSLSIEDIDKLLDELEQVVRAGAPRQRVLNAVLERLTYVLQLKGASVGIRTGKAQWLTTASSGESIELNTNWLASATEDDPYAVSRDSCLLAVPIRKPSWGRGAIVVRFAQTPPKEQLGELAAVCDAFAEIIALRQMSELESLLDEKWQSLQSSLKSLAKSSSRQEGACRAANDLAFLAEADRVSLISQERGVLSVSGAISLDRRSDSVVAIKRIGLQTIAQESPLCRRDGDQDGEEAAGEFSTRENNEQLTLGSNYACIPFNVTADEERPSAAVLFEWDKYEQFLNGCTILNYLFPAFSLGWQHLHQMLGIPRSLRWAFSGRFIRRPFYARVARWAIVAVLIIVAGYVLSLPTPIRIEAAGSLQPVQQRVVFTSIDGIVSKLHVEDGELVRKGELLATLTAPMLDIELQEVAGEIQAITEKRDGLHVAVNQIFNNNQESRALQSKMSSEIRQLETQLENLEAKHIALLDERSKLQVLAPIDGVVVSREIERFLDLRPVRRGDALLRVVQLDGPWQLELLVADRDSGYLKRKLAESGGPMVGHIPQEADRAIEYVIASKPDQRMQADVIWVSESARNPAGEGMFIDVRASVDEAGEKAHMGASVNAYIECSQQPLWFVWSRPLVEAIQRRLWF